MIVSPLDGYRPNDRRGFVHKRLIGAVSGFIGGGPAGAAKGFFGPGLKMRQPLSQQLVVDPRCPPGHVGNFRGLNCQTGVALFTGDNRGSGFAAQDREGGDLPGRRKKTGFLAGAQRFFPGGETGFFEFGEAVMGAFGVPALEPAVVGEIQRRDGSTGPILRCPPRMVLAVDNLCYAKGIKGLASFRKWKPSAKGMISAADVKCLRRANTLRSSKSNKAVFKELGLGG